MTELTDMQKSVIRAMAKNDLNVVRSAKYMNYSRSNLWYHIERIKKKTGLDCRKFYDELKLLEMCDENQD